MRPLSRLALGGGAVSAAAAGALLAGGVFATTATLVVTDPLAPRASADSLRRFDDCGSLRALQDEPGKFRRFQLKHRDHVSIFDFQWHRSA